MLREICETRPFKIRNADEYELSEVFDLFVNPQKSLINPFEFENNIVKGRMGSGKTMYLRANHAYYQYTLVVSLLDDVEPILPIYIKLSDYQSLQNPEEIYNSVILRIIKEIINSFNNLKDATKLAMLHNGFTGLPDEILEVDRRMSAVLSFYKKLTSDQFSEKIATTINESGGIKWKVFELARKIEKQYETVLTTKSKTSFENIEDVYKLLLGDKNGKLLILLDEAGSINRSFFKAENETQSFFEILMNQLRTLEFARVKIAIYPQTVSDILTETRYGDVVYLQENIFEDKGFNSFKTKALNIIHKYIKREIGKSIDIQQIFNNSDGRDPVEQLINASNGNYRRLIQLFDLAMTEYYEHVSNEDSKIDYRTVEQALLRSAKSMEDLHSDIDKEFLESVSKACKARGAYKFMFPNNAPNIYKFTNKSLEYNPINIAKLGSGRRGTVYAFDYAFCVYKGIPTHYLFESERIDKSRSISSGSWINKITTLSEELLEALEFPGKVDGVIEYLNDGKGFIKTDEGKTYFFTDSNIIEQDRDRYYCTGKAVRFYPAKIEDAYFATSVEIP